MATVATVNAALRVAGIPGRLHRGRGYYWMADVSDDYYWDAMYSSVLEVFSIGDMSVDAVVRMVDDLRNARMNA